MSSKQAMVRTIETQACLFSTGNHYHYIYWTKVKTLHYNYLYFARKYLIKKNLLKLIDVSQTSSKRYVETPSICLVWCLSYAPLSVKSFIHWFLLLRMRKLKLLCLSELVIIVLHKNTRNWLITWNRLRNQTRIYQNWKRNKKMSPFDINK